MQGKAGSHKWVQMSDYELESAARYYLWLATNFPDLQNHRLDEIVAEVSRRRKPEILEQAKGSIPKAKGGGG
jgi:hypothetical protein